MKRRALLSVGALTLLTACADGGKTPVAPSGPQLLLTGAGVISDAYDGRPVHGAIFTTTPTGTAVNANVQYTSKIEVYLDGGPRNPNSSAAGLNDGLYVFQVTDPPGKTLLSDDPARCRVVQVQGGVILGTVPANRIPGLGATTDNWADNGQNSNKACHVETSPDGAFATGRHDTNTDTDPGGGVTVQLYPFQDTPNPGGVYKAWMTPLQTYVQKSGSISTLNNVPAAPSGGKNTAIGYAPDKGFANPARNNVKTDNFKVVNRPPFIRISKVVDGQARLGWLVTVYEYLEGQWVGAGWRPTVATFGVPLDAAAQLLACEQLPAPFVFVSATVGGQSVSPSNALTQDELGNPIVCVPVPGFASAATVDVVFNNTLYGSLSWTKVDGATPPRLLGGATFRVRRTHDQYGAAVSSPDFYVTDNSAPDVDADGGEFTVTNLPLGRYCIKETAAPAGYLVSPTEQCGIELTPAAPSASAQAFVDGLIGRMTGGTGQVQITDDIFLTSGFTIHCDIVLSNNLEINWPGNKWHLDKPISTALCTDEPNVEPGQPDAPFDTFYGTAVGQLNGVAGSRIQFTFQDGGEPGKRADLAAIKIWRPNGSVALDLSLRAIKGNIQAHEDQPHK